MKHGPTHSGLQMRLAARGISVHRERHFLGSVEGKKVLLFGAALAAVVFAILWGQLTRERRVLEATTRHLPGLAVAVTAPPLAFVPAEVRHRLLAAEDLSEEVFTPGVRALTGYFDSLHAPVASGAGATPPSLPAESDIVDLRIAEALADARIFRGGWVKIDGVVSTLWTESLDNPDAPESVQPLYKGFLVENPKSSTGGVLFVTTTPPPEFTAVRDHVALRGVFLQNIRIKTKDPHTPYRELPLIVLEQFKVTSTAKGSTSQSTFLPIAVTVGAVVVVLIFLMIMRRRSRGAPAAQFARRGSRNTQS